MPEQPTPNDPNVDDRNRHLNRCGELRKMFKKLDDVIQRNFDVVQIKEDFNPDSETFLQFLKKAHESALEVWG